MSSIHVLKFGGTSLKDADLINQAANIIAERRAKADPIVVVSALAGVTNQLLAIADMASTETSTILGIIHKLKIKHLDLLGQVGPHSITKQFELEQLFDALEAAYNDRKKCNQTPEAWRDELLSFGERASVQLVEAALAARDVKSTPVDSQHLITTNTSFGEARVISDLTTRQIQQSLQQIDAIPVITGFIGSTAEGHITTLGRSGSDYTASLVAGAVCAELLEIWTDVDGVLTADPRLVPSAETIETLSYDDIAELSAHGARVIHPKTIEPLRHCNTLLQVRNSLNPTHPGTKIGKVFPSNGNFQSVTITGPFTQLGIPGDFYQSAKRWLDHHSNEFKINRIGIFRPSAAEPAQFIISQHFFEKVEQKLKQWLDEQNISAEMISDLYMVKKFTNDLLRRDRVVASAIKTLDREDIHPVQWHRGPNRRHFSLLLPESDIQRAAVLLNETSIGPPKTISVFVAGTGAVGGTFIKQIKNLENPDLNVRLLGACNTQTVQWFDQEREVKDKPSTCWPAVIKELRQEYWPTILVDATGSEEVAPLYPKLFEAGVHIVTPSKLANTFEQSYYDQLRKTAEENNVCFRYETTVGAGLPVISTIEALQKAGDTIKEISGIVSGTMTYLFNQLEEGIPFSDAIVKARKEGYAEPDPRDDLSGEDVARKFLTLARETGMKIERSELEVQSLIPEELADVDGETFLERLCEFDACWYDKLLRARKTGATLRYTGRLADGKISIGVEEVSPQSTFGQLKGTDNLICIFTERYDETPLIIQGPGAGKEVTAAGVLADVLKVADDIN